MLDRLGAHHGVRAGAVGEHRLGDQRQDLAHVRIVGAQHRGAVERQVLQELRERLLELREVVLVGIHVVGVDVGDHRDHRLQVQERGVGLVGLDDDEVAGAEARVGAGGVEAPADDEGRVEPASASTLATRLVVVVLPWVPAIATPCLRRISSASISARGTTGMRALARRRRPRGCRPAPRSRPPRRRRRRRSPCRCLIATFAPEAGEAPRGGVLREVRAAHLVAEVGQHLGDAATCPSRRCRRNGCAGPCASSRDAPCSARRRCAPRRACPARAPCAPCRAARLGPAP